MLQYNEEIYQEWGNPEYGDYLKTVYNNLPTAILEYLKENKLRVVILEEENSVEDLYEKIYHDEVKDNHAGLTIPALSTSFIEGCLHKNYYSKYGITTNQLTKEEYNKLEIKNILIHEIGQIDLSSNFMFSENSFKDIYFEEVENFKKTRNFLIDGTKSTENIRDNLEYFASSFACYILYLENLMEYCPLTYQYIDTIINEITLKYKNQIK